MPRIDDLNSGCYIKSEEEIPEEYRNQLTTESEEIVSTPIISGEKGNVIEEDEIADMFSDTQTEYLGHGTIGGEEIINLILQTGLKVKNPEAIRGYDSHLRGVDSTTSELGNGKTDLFSEIKEKLENWPHNDAKDIIIISIPKEYIVSQNSAILGTDRYEAICIGSEEQGYRLRPEFIKGIYNANTHSFTLNENFYKNLPQETKQQLLESVKQKYIQLYANRSILSPKEDEYMALEGEDLEKLTLEWYKVQFSKLKEKQARRQQFDDELFEICKDTTVTEFNGISEILRGEDQQEQTAEYERNGG